MRQGWKPEGGRAAQRGFSASREPDPEGDAHTARSGPLTLDT